MKRAHPGKHIMNALTDFLQQLHFETLINRKILPSPPTLGYGSEKKFPKKIENFTFSKFVLVDPGESKSTGSASKVIRNVPKWLKSAPKHPQINHKQILKK